MHTILLPQILAEITVPNRARIVYKQYSGKERASWFLGWVLKEEGLESLMKRKATVRLFYNDTLISVIDFNLK